MLPTALFILTLGVFVSAQRVALVAPETGTPAAEFAAAIESKLHSGFKIINPDLAAAAFRATAPAEPFNMEVIEAANVGSAIGGDYFVVVRSKSQRRAGRGDELYFDTFGAVYVVASRTGQLIDWEIRTTRGASAAEAEKALFKNAPEIATSISTSIRLNQDASIAAKVGPGGPPDESSPEFKRFKPPAPYRRIAPAYTASADLYAIEATVDIEVDFDDSGRVTATNIVRWAGFGLDQSVESTVRAMNWRPAFQDGKPRPVRVLLRYNFRKQPSPKTK